LQVQLRSYKSTIELHGIIERHKPSVVVWAGGYGWNQIPFLNARGDIVDIAVDGKGQAILDSATHTLQTMIPNLFDGSTSVVPIPHCYAVGLGAGVITKDQHIREDGFSFYCGKSAATICGALVVPPPLLSSFNVLDNAQLFRCTGGGGGGGGGSGDSGGKKKKKKKKKKKHSNMKSASIKVTPVVGSSGSSGSSSDASEDSEVRWLLIEQERPRLTD